MRRAAARCRAARRDGDGGPKTAYVNRYGDPLGLKSNTWVVAAAADLQDPRRFDAPAELQRHPPRVSGNGRVVAVHYRDPSGQPAHGHRQGGRRGVLGDRDGAAADAVGGASPPTFDAGASTRTICSASTSSPTASAARAVMPGRFDKSLIARQRLGDRLLRHRGVHPDHAASGPAARSTTTPPTRRCRSRWRAPTAARTSTRSGTRSSATRR